MSKARSTGRPSPEAGPGSDRSGAPSDLCLPPVLLQVVLIALGGGVGAAARFLLSRAVQRAAGVGAATGFPWGTLVVNVLGCALLGAAMAWFATHTRIREEYRIAVAVGLLGGFTTFSTYAYETFALAERGHGGRAMLNLALSTAAGLAAVWVGYRGVIRLLGD